MTPAISIQNLSKRYVLGVRQSGRYHTLRETMMSAAAAPLRKLGKLLSRRERGADGNNPELWALKDVSFQINPGEAVGVVGHNGAGKSTLLKVLSRITAPTRGSVVIRGRVGTLLEVGTGFHQELTGRENVYLNGAIIGMSRTEIARKFDAIVEFAEVEKFIDTPVKRYSSGMYVRLAFAVAAHLEPDVLLIDEVLSVGDLAFQRKCMDHVKKMLAKNVTVMFVSHNMFAVKALCDRALFMSHGMLQADGPTEEITRVYDQESKLETASWAAETVGSDPTKCPIYITKLEMLDEAGNPQAIFDYGSRMRFRLHYRCNEPVKSPNFNISMIRSDNVACCNYNTVMDEFHTGTVQGEGVIELLTPPLKLIAEQYSVQVLIWDSKFQQIMAAQTARNFHVRHQMLSTEFGVFHENAQWKWGDPSQPAAIEDQRETVGV